MNTQGRKICPQCGWSGQYQCNCLQKKSEVRGYGASDGQNDAVQHTVRMEDEGDAVAQNAEYGVTNDNNNQH